MCPLNLPTNTLFMGNSECGSIPIKTFSCHRANPRLPRQRHGLHPILIILHPLSAICSANVLDELSYISFKRKCMCLCLVLEWTGDRKDLHSTHGCLRGRHQGKDAHINDDLHLFQIIFELRSLYNPTIHRFSNNVLPIL